MENKIEYIENRIDNIFCLLNKISTEDISNPIVKGLTGTFAAISADYNHLLVSKIIHFN